MVALGQARTPPGMRLYAIGDVHGCLDALAELHDQIRADLARRPIAGPGADWRIVHLGDYVDRGADSRGVIDFLIARMAETPRVLCLRGNHDEMFEDALAGGASAVELWLLNGGDATLESYGHSLTRFLDDFQARRPLADAVPQAHRAFLAGLGNSARFGDYYFVHAGIDPGRTLDRQVAEAQLWIRDPFLNCRTEFEAVVVHGHTPVRRVAVRANRIGIDTGAVFGGALSCLVLEDLSRDLLANGRIVALPKAC